MKYVFGQGRPIYTFENRCIQDTDIVLGDMTTKIFLNPYYKVECVNPELGNFLKFLTDGKPVDEYTEWLVEAVEAARNNEYLNVEYMSMWAMQTDARAAGREEGLSALVATFKTILKDFDTVYEKVRSNEVYADVSREEVMEYYQKCP